MFHTPENELAGAPYLITVTAPGASSGARTVGVTGWPTGWTSFPKIVTAVRAGLVVAAYEATGYSAGNLSLSGVTDGYTDAALLAADTIELRPTKLAITEIQTAVTSNTAAIGTINTTLGTLGSAAFVATGTFDAAGAAAAVAAGLGTAAARPATDFISATATETANTVLAGPTTGSAAAPTFRAMVAADLPATYLTANQTITLSGNVTGSGATAITTTIAAASVTNAMLAGSITASNLVGTDIATVGTITTGTWTGTTVAIAHGGTGQTSASAALAALGGQAGPLTGDVTTSGAAATLANTAVTAGSYTVASITVDAKGRLTAAASGSSAITIGTTPVSGGTAGRVLFEGTGPVVSDSAGITYDGTNLHLSGALVLPDGIYSLKNSAGTNLLATSANITYWYNGSAGTNFRNSGDTASVLALTNTGATFLATATTSVPLSVQAKASQTAPLVALQAISSTSTARDVAYVDTGFTISTDAIYTGYGRLCGQDAAATAGGREVYRWGANGSAPVHGWFGATMVVRQTDGAALTNNVVASGTTNQIDDFTSLTVYATDAQAIHNSIYQLARKVKLISDALRAYGLMT